MFKNVFSDEGRIRRTEFWLSLLAVSGLVLCIPSITDFHPIAGFLYLCLCVWLIAVFCTKRCHDLGRPGWFTLIPFFSLFMLFADGDSGHNKYGPDPREESNGTEPVGAKGSDGDLMTASLYLEAAGRGDANAQCCLGICYYNGYGVDADSVLSVFWYHKAALQGNAAAQYKLAFAYYNAEGVKKDAFQSAFWYRKAAELGDADAQCAFGWCCEYAEGVKKDMVQAASWYSLAADQGHAHAQRNLGVCYYYGSGVELDFSRAAEWFLKSANQGHAEAQNDYGLCCENGEGVAKDIAIAIGWYRLAAAQGESDALSNLARFYSLGIGVMKDEVEAYAFYNIASVADRDARKALARLEKKMSPDARLLGQQRSKELKKEIEAKVGAR